jgi:uncharacterized protein
MKQNARTFLGNGLHFPLRTNARGELMLVSGSEDIEQAIGIILGTRPGERVMRPNFGCRAYELIFSPRSAETISLLQEYINQALRMWEPRIEVQRVTVSADTFTTGRCYAEIAYLIKATHDIRSIVYPFFIEQEEEIL